MQSKGEMQSLLQVASMYYKDHINQQEIADKMGITRQTVNRLLKKAELTGVVEFRIHNPLEALPELSAKLEQRFGLKRALVVPCKFRDREMVTNIIAQFAAQYIAALVEEGAENIGLSWGRTVYHSILNLPVAYCGDATFFPLVGASSQTAEYFMINEIVRRAASTMNARAVYTYIPADPGSREDAELFRRTKVYEIIDNYWKHIDLAVMGIGVNPVLEIGSRAEYPGERYVRSSVLDDAVGDMLTHYFDASGRFIPLDQANILCASIDNLRAAKRVLAIAGGKDKLMPICSALKTGIITDFITDELVCECLLKMR
ncbi:MAG: winged helix-turn-helix transcriptional regulator [Clostridia bacterium]|nr:winged helix-turn-helix transcriptional regulator [Clostridia bacterium]